MWAQRTESIVILALIAQIAEQDTPAKILVLTPMMAPAMMVARVQNTAYATRVQIALIVALDRSRVA